MGRDESLKGGIVPRWNYSRSTLNQFAMWEQVLYYCTAKSDGSVHFCLMALPSLKAQALEYDHT